MRELINTLINTGTLVILGLATVALLIVSFFWVRYQLGRLLDQRRWRRLQRGEHVSIGAVSSLTITPVFEWLAGDGKYIADAGASYLIEADDTKILFDLGDNRPRRTPSPLFHNLKAMGLDPGKLVNELSAIVVSHRHREHTGGIFGFLRRQPAFDLPLDDVPTYTSWGRNHGRKAAREIAPGVLLSANLPGRLFSGGRIGERMLLINVAGKGLVCIVGDAHPEPLRMILYASQITGVKPYAYVGGVHALLDDEIPLRYRIILSKQPPWKKTNPEEIGLLAVGMREFGIEKLYVSEHDSDFVSLGILKTVFGDEMTSLRVGEAINFT